jgi:hypothetical protein
MKVSLVTRDIFSERAEIAGQILDPTVKVGGFITLKAVLEKFCGVIHFHI